MFHQYNMVLYDRGKTYCFHSSQLGQLAINPFAGYLISPEVKVSGFLNKQELDLLVNAKMKNAQYELARDLLVFSCFCGFSYSDVKNLTRDNIQTSFDGHLWIITRRQRKQMPIKVFGYSKFLNESYTNTKAIQEITEFSQYRVMVDVTLF